MFVCMSRMCVCIQKYLPTYLPTYLPAYLPTCLPAYLPTCLPAYLPTCLPAYLPTCLPAYLPSYLPSFLPSFLPSCGSLPKGEEPWPQPGSTLERRLAGFDAWRSYAKRWNKEGPGCLLLFYGLPHSRPRPDRSRGASATRGL